MPRPSRFAVSLLGVWLGVVGRAAPAAAEDFAFFHENVMGTSLELHVVAGDAGAARAAEGRVLGAIDRLSKVFSGYDRESEFSRWQAAPAGPVAVSPELFEVLRACERWREFTGGAFDPRVEALSRLWAGCARLGRLPTREESDAARALMGRLAWRLDPAKSTAERLFDGPLSLNAIAKGYIVERACEAVMGKVHGVRGVLLNVGGDLRACGEAVRTVGIVSPMIDSESSEPITRVEVRDRAVATSGRSQRGFRIQGKWYSHLFDPKTGTPAAAVAGATVIAERSADADALATAFNVLPVDESLRLAKSLPGVECLIVTADGRVARSDGWHKYERAAPPLLAATDGPKAPAGEAPKAWGDEFEMAINFEINRPEAEPGRYRRPYVAVWIEDKDGFPVRNLLLWVSQGGSGPFQWIPDLKRWYRDDQVRKKVDKTELVLTMSRPTRPPGKYSVAWDGKDDHGKPLPAGSYAVCIDAAREHGTYQGIRLPVTLADRPFSEELQGNVEIRSASVEYRRKAPPK
jgi:thiamine biosynthesis lipoprotein ApbE